MWREAKTGCTTQWNTSDSKFYIKLNDKMTTFGFIFETSQPSQLDLLWTKALKVGVWSCSKEKLIHMKSVRCTLWNCDTYIETFSENGEGRCKHLVLSSIFDHINFTTAWGFKVVSVDFRFCKFNLFCFFRALHHWFGYHIILFYHGCYYAIFTYTILSGSFNRYKVDSSLLDVW